MTRQIKFRAWDKKDCEMLHFGEPVVDRPAYGGYGDVPETDFWAENEGKKNARLTFTYQVEEVTGYNHDDFNKEHDVVLMQFTGLHDKNGKEVFEGDIVRCASLTRNCLHIMEWRKEVPSSGLGGMPGFYLSGLSDGYVWMGEEEIIGNIYENPELLTKE